MSRLHLMKMFERESSGKNGNPEQVFFSEGLYSYYRGDHRESAAKPDEMLIFPAAVKVAEREARVKPSLVYQEKLAVQIEQFVSAWEQSASNPAAVTLARSAFIDLVTQKQQDIIAK